VAPGVRKYHRRVLDRLRRIPALHRTVWLSALVFAVALAFGLPLVRRGIVFSDEGYLLQQALDLLDGRVLYRDMDAFITPGMWFLLAGTFAVFEPSVIASRYLVWVVYAATAWTAFRIVAPVSGRGAALGAVAGLLLFSVWAFPAWTFAFYSPVAVLLCLLGLERLLAWQRSGRGRDLFLVGLLLGLAICFKQNYGTFAVVGAAVGWGAARLAARPSRGAAGDATERGAGDGAARDAAWVLAGGVTAGLPFLAYLLANGALGAAWQSLVVHPFEFAGRHDIPYATFTDLVRPDLYTDGVEKLTYLSYPALRAGPIGLLQVVRGTQRLHVLAYWLPPLVLAGGLLLALARSRTEARSVDVPLLTVVATCGMVFLGVLPRADFNHLVNVDQPAIVAGAVVLQRGFARLPRGARKTRALLAAPLVLVALLYGGTALVWYDVLIRTHVVPVEGPRGGILVDPVDGRKIDDLVRTIERHTEPDGPLLTVPDYTMLNFLTGRFVPSPYYNLYEHHIAGDRGEAVAEGAERHDVRLAITRYDNFFSDRVGLVDYAPVLVDYLVTHFERAFVGPDQDYIVYVRRPEPVPQTPFEDALTDCVSESSLAEVRHHLLFSTLYHRSTLTQPMPAEGLRTTCRVRVSEDGGVLSLELGYLRPHASLPGTQLVAEIAVLDGGDRERIHYEALRVVPARSAKREQPYRRVDLSVGPWAGREVSLEFRTRLSGRVAPHPLDWKGFAMTYRDPRLQAEPGGARP